MPGSEPKICVGVVVGAHGVKGAVRIKPFTERPEAVAAYGPVSDEAGLRRFEVTVLGQARGVVTAQLSGVADRTVAETLIVEASAARTAVNAVSSCFTVLALNRQNIEAYTCRDMNCSRAVQYRAANRSQNVKRFVRSQTCVKCSGVWLSRSSENPFSGTFTPQIPIAQKTPRNVILY